MAMLRILINIMCTVNIRGHEANFYEAEARCHEADIEAEARKSEADIPVKQCCDSPVRPSVCLSVCLSHALGS